MADFTALKTAIQTYIKQNGNEEITGEILQEVLLSMVTTLGDSAINDLVTALANEVAARQNADGTLQQNITSEATARGNADTALGGRIDDEATARANGDTALSNRLGSSITSENTAADQIGAEAEARAAADTALQGIIDGITDNIENGYVYAGIATPSSTPATGKVFYLALTAGTYTNFDNTEVSQGINILKYNGSAWSLDAFIGIDDELTPGSNKLPKSGNVLENIIKNGSAFDLSAYNAVDGVLATYADLDAALAALNLLPAVYKQGGMSFRFVQTSDNKYVQARCMAQNFTTDVTKWQGVDDEPTAGSENLVKSGGVSENIKRVESEYINLYKYVIDSKNLFDLQNIGKGIRVTGDIGDTINYEVKNLQNFGYCIIENVENTKVNLALRGGTSSPSYTLIDKNGIILQKDDIVASHFFTLEIPSNGHTLIINNDFAICPIPSILFENSIDKEFQNIITHNFTTSSSPSSILPNIEKVDNCFIDMNNNFGLTTSGSWDSYKIELSEYVPTKVKLYNGAITGNYVMIGFYKSLSTFNLNTLIGLYPFAQSNSNELTSINIPDGAKCAICCNRKTSGTDIIIDGVRNIGNKSVALQVELCSLNKKYATGYIDANGDIHESTNWQCWELPLDFSAIDLAFYTNNFDFYTIGFYNGVPSATTFISGIKAAQKDTLDTKTLNKTDVPTGSTHILFASRITSGDNTSAKEIINTESNQILNTQLNTIFKDFGGKSNIFRIYKDVLNTNDFVIIKDELWLAVNQYSGGVASENTTIYRYEFTEDYSDLVFKETLSTDFGHWNTVDYNEHNDCLVFSNSANETTTVGNYFHIIKNPLNLHGSVLKDEVGIKYEVDLGYKVNLVWGDSNLGQYNILYALSNNSATLTKLLLERDANGDFNGNYSIIESVQTNISVGIGGMAFWGDSLYIGIGSKYGIGILNLTDLSYKELTKHYYNPDGTQKNGSTQGLYIDSKSLWVFSNVGGKNENYLIQYCR